MHETGVEPDALCTRRKEPKDKTAFTAVTRLSPSFGQGFSTSQVAQMVKNPSTMQGTQAPSQCWEDPPE